MQYCDIVILGTNMAINVNVKIIMWKILRKYIPK